MWEASGSRVSNPQLLVGCCLSQSTGCSGTARQKCNNGVRFKMAPDCWATFRRRWIAARLTAVSLHAKGYCRRWRHCSHCEAGGTASLTPLIESAGENPVCCFYHLRETHFLPFFFFFALTFIGKRKRLASRAFRQLIKNFISPPEKSSVSGVWWGWGAASVENRWKGLTFLLRKCCEFLK